ncbi:MAG TPA: hypothetical protein VNI84_13850 [Pyrinomonadaceae bacterium]|nr:hypothetical protein [Pyrinomonadaceae bacterium]
MNLSNPPTAIEAIEIELTSEVLSLSSFADTAAKIDAIHPVQWSAQKEDNALWKTKRNSVTIINGEVSIDPNSLLARVRIRSLKRFGLPSVLDSRGEPVGTSGAVGFFNGYLPTTLKSF